MTLPIPELLERMAATVRTEIGPSVDGAFPRTQAFMAAVVLEKVARQVALAPEHERADAADIALLFADLDAMLPAAATPPLLRAVVAQGLDRGDGAVLCRLIEALYAQRVELGPAFEVALGRVRTTLRAAIDRRVEYAA